MQYLNFNDLVAANPYNTPPAGWTRVGTQQTMISTVSSTKFFARTTGTGLQFGCWVANETYTGNTIFARTVLPVNATTTGNDSIRAALLNSSGNGYALWISQSGLIVKVYTVTNYTGITELASITSYGAGYSQTFEIRATDKSTGTFKVLRNGVQIGSDIVDTTYTDLIYSGAAASGGRVGDITTGAIYDVLTLTNPVVAGGAISGTSSGAVDGAGTLSHGGVTASVTFADGGTTYSGTWPLPVDSQVYPYLPVVGGTFTLAQGGSSDTIVSDLNPPAGMNAVTFGTIITDDPYYLGAALVTAGYTIANVRRCYYPDTLLILPDSAVQVVSGSLPRTEQIIIHMADGNTYYEDLNLSVDGAVGVAPTMPADDSVTVNEGDTVVGTYAATAGTAPITYSLTGADASDFSVNSSTGALTFASPSVVGTYTVNVVATNAYGSDSTTVSVTVDAVAIAPTMPSDTSVSLQAGATTLGTFLASSGTAPITYSLTGASAGLFNINSSTAVVTFISPAVVGSGSVNVVATNSEGSDSQTITFTVSAVTVGDSDVTLQGGRVEAREQMAVVRVKLAYQANSVAATVADLRTDFNSLISKMDTRGWFTGGEVQTTMLKVAMQNGLIQFLNRIKKQAPDQMDVQSASVAADVAALRTDFNALLTKLKAANLMASS